VDDPDGCAALLLRAMMGSRGVLQVRRLLLAAPRCSSLRCAVAREWCHCVAPRASLLVQECLFAALGAVDGAVLTPEEKKVMWEDMYQRLDNRDIFLECAAYYAAVCRSKKP
jgi:hypothetical protein